MRTSNSKFRLVSEVVFTVYPKTFGVNRSAKRKLKNLATSYGFGIGREDKNSPCAIWDARRCSPWSTRAECSGKRMGYRRMAEFIITC